jgi:hypothetical protein
VKEVAMHDLDRTTFEAAPTVGTAEHEEFLDVLDELLHPQQELAGARAPAARGLGARATQAIRNGERDENVLTDLIFSERHPELGGRRIRPDERDLAAEWLRIRDAEVRPALNTLAPAAPSAGSPATGQPRSDTWLKTQWRDYACQERLMVSILVLSNAVHVNPETVGAFTRLAETLTATGYRASGTGAYNCRVVKGGTATSLHSYGLALDVDADCNPWLPGKTGSIRFPTASTQAERCREVKAGRADTSFTPAQIAAVEAIRTVDGLRVFQWGGRWNSLKDSMHFQIDVSPAELDRGIAAP